jgi:DNA-binding MarR family transcriptional regulator
MSSVKRGQSHMDRDYEDMPGHLARRFQQIAVAVFQAEMGAVGADITPVQYATLAAIRAHPGTDQTTLAGIVALDRTTITGVVDRLEAKSLILRDMNDRDRRAKHLAVTEKGKALLATLEPHVDAAQRLITRGLTPNEESDLIRLLRKVIDAGNDLSRAPQRS